MKSKVLEAHGSVPAFEDATELSKLPRIKVSVTEQLDTEVVDILVDKNNQVVKVRVDGKGRGPDWKFWKDRFEASPGSAYLLNTCPISLCIIRCSTNRSPTFMKVLGVLSVDPVTDRKNWIPFEMVEKFCKTCDMSPMPTVYSGPMDMKHIKGLVDRPILPAKRTGILVIPSDKPVRYISVPENVDTDILKPRIAKDEKAFASLCIEYANRAFDEHELKAQVHSEETLKTFVKEMNNRASRDIMLLDYIQRCEKEAGVPQDEARNALKDEVFNRASKMWEKWEKMNA